MLQINKNAWVHYFFIYLMIITTGAMIFVQNRNSVLLLILGIYAWCAFRYRRFRVQEPLLWVGFLFLAIVTVRMISGGIGLDTWYLYAGQILVVYLCVFWNPDKCIDRFILATTFFAVASLVCWGILMWNRTLLESLLSVQSSSPLADGRIFTYKGVLLYTLPTHVLYTRNTGIFSEPGRFQAMLHGALYCCLFLRNRTTLKIKSLLICIIVITVTIITTQSTTGYIGLLILVIGFLVKKPVDIDVNTGRKIKRTLLIGLGLVAAYMLYDFFAHGANSLLSLIMFDKLGDTDITVTASSGGARLRMVQQSIEQLMRTPWGAGTFYLIGENVAGGGLFRFFAIMGIIPTTLFFIWIIKPFVKEHQGIELVIFLAMYINMGLGQSYAFYSTVLLIPLAYRYILPKENAYGGKNNETVVAR